MDGFTLLAVALSALLLLAATVYVLRAEPPSSAPAPPSPQGLPLIGHLHLVSDMPHHAFADLARRLGPIFRLMMGRVPAVVVSSADLARDVLRTHDHVFANRPQLVSAQYLSFGCSDVTFSRHGPYWRQARKICVTELLSPRRVASFDRVRAEEVARLVRGLAARAGTETDVSSAFFNLANDILCRVAFGRRFSGGGRGSEGKGGLVEVMKETQALFAGFCAGDFYPEWGWVNWASGYKRRLERNLRDLRSVCDEIIREHLAQEQDDERGEDFVDVLLKVQRREDLEVPITDDNLKALVLVNIFFTPPLSLSLPLSLINQSTCEFPIFE